jgi:hypothetical protein
LGLNFGMLHLRRKGEVGEEKQWAEAPLIGGPDGWVVAGAGTPRD